MSFSKWRHHYINKLFKSHLSVSQSIDLSICIADSLFCGCCIDRLPEIPRHPTTVPRTSLQGPQESHAIWSSGWYSCTHAALHQIETYWQHDPATYRDETFIKANQLSLVQLLRECLCGGRLNCRGWGFYLTNIKRKRCCCCFWCDQTPTRTSTLNQLKDHKIQKSK